MKLHAVVNFVMPRVLYIQEYQRISKRQVLIRIIDRRADRDQDAAEYTLESRLSFIGFMHGAKREFDDGIGLFLKPCQTCGSLHVLRQAWVRLVGKWVTREDPVYAKFQ